MTRKEAITQVRLLRDMADTMNDNRMKEATDMAIEALQTEPCEDCISRQAVHDMLENLPITVEDKWFNWLQKACIRLAKLPSVQPEPKKGFISIADVMSVFDDFMCGDVDEDGNATFLEMLKDKAESEAKDEDGD